MTALSIKDDILHAALVGSSIFVAVVAGALLIKTTFIASEPSAIALADAPRVVTVAPRTFTYRAAGEYYENGYEVDAPMRTVSVSAPLTIMKYQVSRADYARCVADGACGAAEPEFRVTGDIDVPVTGVSYTDAEAYASWLSGQTGEFWRLPTDEELAFAAGSRFPDDALGSSSNPADRWLANYRKDAERSANRDGVPKPLGHFGENELGVSDFAGNVWEWSTTCRQRTDLDRGPTASLAPSSCGIYWAAGQHRAAMVFFVRNPKGGGCAVGAPPDNLGFRLVKETTWYEPLLVAVRSLGIRL
ncbi:MAG TPA: SUMF1/EgtB/PvdO family nonheme iron enzyme [Hyphomicrobium sp.]|nr:SUMF1/EgtB/PvdO family nonheme iron enzyme [Hyphomicrobium sp.]